MEQPAPSETQLQSWERSWDYGELRGGVANWSLASDAGLLLHLKDFSKNLMNKTKDLEQKVDNLMFATKATDIKLHNTFNRLLMLSNMQYIENRVYEDDIVNPEDESAAESSKAQDENLSHEQLEAILIPKYTEAIGMGTTVMKTVERDVDEMEEDDEEYMGENVFAQDPLPFVIGTRAFEDDDFAGILYISDFSDEEDEEVDDLSGEATPLRDGVVPEDEEEYEESDEEAEVKPKGIKKKDPFASESDEEETSRGGGDLASDLMAAVSRSKKKVDAQEGGDDVEWEESSGEEDEAKERKPGGRAARMSRSQAVDSDDDENNSGEEDVEPKEPLDFKSQLALTIGGGAPKAKKKKKLELSDGEELDDEDAKPKTESSSKKSNSLFGDDDDDSDLFGGDEEKAVDGKSSKRDSKRLSGQKEAPKKRPKSFFDEDDDDGADLFGMSESGSKKEKTNLFGDEPEPVVTKRKLPAGAKKLFPTADDVANDKNVKEKASSSLFGDEDEPIEAEKVESKPSKRVIKKPLDDFSSLFGGDDEGETKSKTGLFGDEPATTPSKSPARQKKKTTSSLFGDEDSEDLFGFSDDKPKSTPATKKKVDTKSLFSFDNDDDLFGTSTPTPKKEESDEISKRKSVSFSGDTKDEVTPAKESATPKKKSGLSSLFGDDGGGDELFGSPAPKSSNKKVLSLFDADDDMPKPAAAKSAAKKAPASSLFGDDDVDLFGAPAAKSVSAPAAAKTDSLFEESASALSQEEKSKPKKQLVKGKSVQKLMDTIGGTLENSLGSGGQAPPSRPSSSLIASEEDDDAPFFDDVVSKEAPAKVEIMTDKQASGEGKQLEHLTKARPVQSGKRPPSRVRTGRAGGAKKSSSTTPKPSPAASKVATPKREPSPKPVEKPVEKKEKPAEKKSASLFGDDDKADLFGGPVKVSTPSKAATPVKKASLFGDDDELFGTPVKPAAGKEEPAKPAAVKAVPKKAASLFGDDDDLFAPLPTKATPAKAATPVKTEVKPEIEDLSPMETKPTTTKAAVKVSPKPPAKAPAKSAADELDDIFGDAPTTPKKAAPAKTTTVKPATTTAAKKPATKKAPVKKAPAKKTEQKNIFDDIF